jgi:predicted nuclease of predicted toxin-antitoxin system
MWLLDANMDVHVIDLFAEFGVPCEAAGRRGWESLNNGELVSAAVQAGFTCILTHDRHFAESAAASLREGTPVAVVIVRLPQKPWRQYVRDFREAWMKQPINPRPGSVVEWPESAQEVRTING